MKGSLDLTKKITPARSNITADNAKTRILHFAKIVSRNDFVDSIISNIDDQQYEKLVVTFEQTSLTLSPVFQEKSIKHINLNVYNARNFLKLVPALNRIIREYQIDIVHCHLFEESILSGFLKLLNPNVKFIIGRHYSDEIYLLHTGIKRKIWLSIEGFANNMADRIIAGSQMVFDILCRQKVPAQKVACIPYGFDFDDHRYKKNSVSQTASIRSAYGIKDTDLMLVNVGRLFNLKGQELLIEVFADLCQSYPQIKLLIIGDGPDREKLQKKVNAAGLKDKIVFTGWLKDAHVYLAAADIVVHPTLSEMFSQLMIEAMALGKPLIINNVSAVPDVITHKVTGLICSHRHDDWRDAVRFLLEHPEERERIGREAERFVKTNYSIKDIIKRYESLYESLNSK
jgi:glycosyltransferase involved in cell wall biosynthesis